MRKPLLLAAILVATAVAAPAAADMPNDDGGSSSKNCEPVDECVACYPSYVDENGNDDGSFQACAAAAERDGLVEACSEDGGTTYFCPPGVDITTGCSIVPGLNAEAALASAGALFAAAALLRARRVSRGSRRAG